MHPDRVDLYSSSVGRQIKTLIDEQLRSQTWREASDLAREKILRKIYRDVHDRWKPFLEGGAAPGRARN